MASTRRKQDDKHLKVLREIVLKDVNRVCFDCHQKGPTYVDMTIGSFVCTTCSGILRGLNPPHRVKSISMSSFSTDEIEQIKSKGNNYCQTVWLGLHDGKSNVQLQSKDEDKIRDFMIAKYEKKRFYVDPSVALKNGYSGCPRSESSSSAASTPGSDGGIRGSGFPAPPQAINSVPPGSIARPVSSSAMCTSSASSNGLPSIPGLKGSTSLDLLSGLSTGAPSKPIPSPAKDPFGSVPQAMPPPSTQGFANFENANIFSSAPTQGSSAQSTPLAPSSSTFPSFAAPPAVMSASDRYAALKDLDEAFRFDNPPTQPAAAVPTPAANQGSMNVFGSPPSSSGQTSAFGTPPVASRMFPTEAQSSGAAWNAFANANPFSNGVSSASANANMSAPPPTWTNGSSSAFGGPTQQPPQGNPFTAGSDPPFNSQFLVGSGLTGNSTNGNINSSGGPAWTASFGGNSFGNNSAFGTTSQPVLVNGGTTPTAAPTNPWGSSSPPNPFKASGMVPPSGSSYNPFL